MAASLLCAAASVTGDTQLPVLFQFSQPSYSVAVFRGADLEKAKAAGLVKSGGAGAPAPPPPAEAPVPPPPPPPAALPLPPPPPPPAALPPPSPPAALSTPPPAALPPPPPPPPAPVTVVYRPAPAPLVYQPAPAPIVYKPAPAPVAYRPAPVYVEPEYYNVKIFLIFHTELSFFFMAFSFKKIIIFLIKYYFSRLMHSTCGSML